MRNGKAGVTGWTLTFERCVQVETTRWPHWPLLYVDFWARWITWSRILQTGYRIIQKEKIQFLLTDRLLNLHSCSVPFCTNSSTVRAPGLDARDAKLQEPSRTEKVLSCCQRILTGEYEKQPWSDRQNLSRRPHPTKWHRNVLIPSTCDRLETDKNISTSPVTTNKVIVIMKCV